MNQVTQTSGIRKKLFLGFGAMLLILVLSIGGVLLKVSTTSVLARQTINVDLPTYVAYQNMDVFIYDSLAVMNEYLLTKDQNLKHDLDQVWFNLEKYESQLDQYSRYWDAGFLSGWQNVKSMLSELKTLQYKALDVAGSNNPADVKKLSTDISSLLDKMLLILDGPKDAAGDRNGGMFDVNANNLEKGAQHIISDVSFIVFLEVFLLIAGIILVVCITLITTSMIVTPLRKAIDIARRIAGGERNIDIAVNSSDETGQLLDALSAMQTAIRKNEKKIKDSEDHARELFNRIAETAGIYSSHSSKVAAGDLTQRLQISEGDEMSGLGKDLNAMTESLSSITRQITNACHNMVSTLTEVKSAVDTQSAGASEQASSINQITASLEEIEKSSSQTIEKAKMLGEIAERTRVSGEIGLEAVEESVNGMKSVREKVQMIAQTILELSNQTQQVGEITAAVNALSQQSKMLALNASIEAAKAGEAGKGFAVVASEVKSLAEQSEKSTAQVQKILEDIRHATERAVMATEEGTKGVDHGTGLVEQTGEVVRNLSEVIHEATIASQQIEAAIRQEAIGIEQITAGMNEINQVTSASVAGVKQTTEAINNLSGIANTLKKQIDAYKI